MSTKKIDQSNRRIVVLSTATANAAASLGLTSNDLGHILGISQASASRLMCGTFLLKESSKSWEMALLLIRLYSGLAALVGNDRTLAMQWLHSPNIAFDNGRPYDHIQTAIGLVFACNYVDAHRVIAPRTRP